MLPFGEKSHLKLSSNVINVYLRQFLDKVTQNEGIMDVFRVCQEVECNDIDDPQYKLQYLPFEKNILQLQGQSVELECVKDKFFKVPNL